MLCELTWQDKPWATKTGILRDTRFGWLVWFIRPLDAADFGSLGPVAMADGDDGYSLEEPGDHWMKFSSMPTKDKDTMATPEESLVGEEAASVFVLESVKSLSHHDECSTPGSGLILIDRCAGTHLTLDSLAVVGRGHTGGREHSEHER